MRFTFTLLVFVVGALVLTVMAPAPAEGSGGFTLRQLTVAGGGATGSGGGFVLSSTVGQAVADSGGQSGGGFSVLTGLLTFAPIGSPPGPPPVPVPALSTVGLAILAVLFGGLLIYQTTRSRRRRALR